VLAHFFHQHPHLRIARGSHLQGDLSIPGTAPEPAYSVFSDRAM
jgi:hypothetical protein